MQDLIQNTPFKEAPALLTFLPMLYVAWSDAVLTEEEITAINQQVASQSWLKQSEKRLLGAWLNPDSPPSAREMRQWLNIMQKSQPQLEKATKVSLVDLGLELARLNMNDGQTVSIANEEAKRALIEVENALGVVSEEATAFILENKSTLSATHETAPSTIAKETAASFNVLAMQQLLDGDYFDLKNEVRQLLSQARFNYTNETNTAIFREQVLDWCRMLAAEGYGALAFPESCGGQNDVGKYLAVFETLGYHDLSMVIKFGVQFGLFGGSVLALGTDKHHQKYLPQLGTLDLPGCFAMTESNHGSNVREIETTATYDKATQEFIIDTPNYFARKDYIGNAGVHGQMATVFAQLIIDGESYGVSAFVVAIRNKNGEAMPGVKIEDCGQKLGLNGVDNGRIWFDQVRIPRENLLNRFAEVSETGEYSSPIASESRRFFTMLGTLVGGRVGVPKAGLSAAKSGLTIAIKYAFKRKQFGPQPGKEISIMDYPTHQKRLMPLLANAYAIHFALEHLLNRFVNRNEKDEREIETLAAGLKAYATWNTTHTLQECREACGGNGYLAENRLGTLKADTEIFTTFEGDNTVLMQLVAKGLLTEFKHSFSSMNFFGLMKFIANQAESIITERNPFTTRYTDVEHLRDSEFHLNAFTYREQQLVYTLARRMQKKIKATKDSYQAFMACQPHFLDAANAFIERIILEEFMKVIDACEDKTLKKTLLQLCDLYALDKMEKHIGWYLEHGYLKPIKSNAVRKQVLELCAEVKENALGLVDAFAIPDNCLGARIVFQ